MRLFDSYRSSAHPFPPDDIDPQMKESPDWLLKVAKAIYSRFVEHKTVFTYSDYEKFDINRRYGQGRQDNDRYKQHYKSTEEVDERAARGYVNLDFQIFSPAPKFKAILRRRMERMRAIPQIRAIDEMSGAERQDQKWSTYFHAINQDIITAFEGVTGEQVPKPDFIPSSMEELEVFSELNGFKLKSEVAYNKALKYTDEISNFEQVKRKLEDDLLDIGACVMKDYVDQEDGKCKLKYIDVGRFIAEYSLNHGFAKSRYFGHFEDYTIAELRHIMPDVPEDEWKKLAKDFAGYSQNPAVNAFDEYDVQYDNGIWGYDSFRVMVLEGEFLSVDTKYRTQHTNRYGDIKYYDDSYGVIRNTQSKKTMTRSVKQWYKFHWVVGSEYLFDSGKQTDVPRPEKSKPRSSYHAWRIPEKPFIERIMTNLDQIQLAYLRLQNAIATAAPDGLAIEWSSLENISVGGEETHPMELLRIHQQTGNLVYRATTHRGNVNMSAAKPVMPLVGGAGKLFEDAIRTMEQHFNWIAELTGIDRFSAGMTPSPETSATASQIAAQGSNEIIEDLAFAFNQVRKSAALNTAHRIALRVKHSDKAYDVYHPALGVNTEILKISADMTPAQMGIYLKMAPDFEQRARITEAAKTAIQAGQIDVTDYLQIERAAEEGDLLYAEALLSNKIRKAQEREQQYQQENIQQQNEGLLRIKQEENQMAQQKVQGETQKGIALQDAKTRGDVALENVKHQNRMREIKAEKSLENANSAASDARQMLTNSVKPSGGTAGK